MKTLGLILCLGFLSLTLTGCAASPPAPSAGGQPRILVNRDKDGLALQGYDPVAYFTDGKPVKGDARFRSAWNGAVYRFASADHKALFDAEPAKYEPQFGGYCGYAASINRVSPVNVEHWQVLDGRLVLQHNQKAWDLWNKDVADNLDKADANWPDLVAKHGKTAKILVNVDRAGVALMGYDPVAYFTEGKPVMGDPMHAAVYGGAEYHFASEEHRRMFESDPAKYEPQFGGYCGYAASINRISPVDPMIFQILEGRLVLQHTPKAYDLFNKDAHASPQRADRNWPGLVMRKGT